MSEGKEVVYMKCARCNHTIKNPYFWAEKAYGVDCWKIIALPEIEAMKEESTRKRLEEWNMKARMLIEVLRMKDLKKINNSFKLSFIPSVIEQMDSTGKLSRKQYELGFDMLNQKDKRTLYDMKYEAGLLSEIDYYSLMALNTSGKEQERMNAIAREIRYRLERKTAEEMTAAGYIVGAKIIDIWGFYHTIKSLDPSFIVDSEYIGIVTIKTGSSVVKDFGEQYYEETTLLFVQVEEFLNEE